MSGGFWLSDRAWGAIEPLLPKNQPGARRVDDRRVISGIIHVLKAGCRWQDCPADYGPSTTIYNRFNRWSHRGLWTRLFATLSARAELPDDLSIDSTAVRAHRPILKACCVQLDSDIQFSHRGSDCSCKRVRGEK